MKKLKVILIGAGNRGQCYTNEMANKLDKFQVVAVAEPIENRRKYIQEKHGIADDMCFDDWRPLLALGKIADVAIIATMDQMHLEPTMEAISLKYDILLEKPVSPFPEECGKIANYAEENNVRIVVCHVLRYTPMFMKIKEIIDNGTLGKIMSINHEECVGNIHQSHSFVRGNWGNSTRSSCMLLQKSCHDMDILQWLIGKKLKKVQSFGMLSYFTEANAPEGSPEYCVDGCPEADTCPYNAEPLYMEEHKYDGKSWMRKMAAGHVDPTPEMIQQAIRNTQYGKCIFKCDNDVVDHQTVNMLFEDDVTVTFTMNAFNEGGRFIHIMGTKGELHAATDGESPIELYEFCGEKKSKIDITGQDGIAGGHGGGDAGIVDAIYDYFNDCYTGKSISTIRESCDNHLIVFAAEEARKNCTVIDFDEFVKKMDKSI